MRAPPDRVVITCAITGNLTTPAQTPHLPVTPEEIADACLGAGKLLGLPARGEARAA